MCANDLKGGQKFAKVLAQHTKQVFVTNLQFHFFKSSAKRTIKVNLELKLKVKANHLGYYV